MSRLIIALDLTRSDGGSSYHFTNADALYSGASDSPAETPYRSNIKTARPEWFRGVRSSIFEPATSTIGNLEISCANLTADQIRDLKRGVFDVRVRRKTSEAGGLAGFEDLWAGQSRGIYASGAETLTLEFSEADGDQGRLTGPCLTGAGTGVRLSESSLLVGSGNFYPTTPHSETMECLCRVRYFPRAEAVSYTHLTLPTSDLV